MRTAFVLALAVASGVAAEPDPPAIKPTTVSLKKPPLTLGEVAAELSKSPAGVTVKVEQPALLKAKVPSAIEATPFWEALETAADETRTRLSLREVGRTVLLEPRPAGREVSAVSGPFRVVPRTVTGRLLLDQGSAFHEVQLDVHWEPRVPVYRIDSQPRVTRAEDDRGTRLDGGDGSSRHYPTGSLTDMKVRLAGLTRDSKRIATLAGEFRATAAEKMLSVPFRDLSAKLPLTQTELGVKVTLASFGMVGGTWDADLELTYPESHPNFESFEEQKWLRDNRLRLVGPNAAVYEPESEDANASGRKVGATYRFKLPGGANPTGKGWSLVCDTPGPLSELKVPFTLKNVPIP